jgi:ABC-2 type transport system permease protein
MYKIIAGFIKKELVQALRDPRMKIMLLLTPMIQMIIFGLALENEIKNVRLYARPLMNDTLFRDIRRNAIGSGWFILPRRNDKGPINASDISLFIRGDMDAALYAPEGGLTQVFEKENRANLEAVIDGSDLIRARSINSYLNSITASAVGARIGRPNAEAFALETWTEPSQTVQMPIYFATRILYNPEMVTSYNLVPGVLGMITCIITIMMTSMSLAKEKEVGTFETLIAAPVTSTEILLGKTIPYIIIGALGMPLVFFIAVAWFRVPMKGPYVMLIIATFFYLVTTVSIGTMISTICRTQQQAMMGSFIFLMPSVLLSGVMFPIENMPWPLTALAHIDPLMYYCMLLRNIMLKGGDHYVLFTHTGALIIIAVVSVGIAFKRFRLHLG